MAQPTCATSIDDQQVMGKGVIWSVVVGDLRYRARTMLVGVAGLGDREGASILAVW